MTAWSKAAVAVAAVAAAAGAGVFAGFTLREPAKEPPPVLDAPATTPVVANREVEQAAGLSEAFISIAQAVTPAVVRIEAERSFESSEGWRSRLFDRFGQESPDGPGFDGLPEVAGGTGILLSEDGLILTNNHVIASADRLTVELSDKRTFEASLVGADPTTDLAVLRIRASGLPAARLGDSDNLRVGEWVLAIGNPGFGDEGTLDFTVTSGIISAKGRPLNVIPEGIDESDPSALDYLIEDFIQTDAVINPGNSGGPLVNLGGLVVGVNTAIASSTGFSEGYGFAIPANLARRVARDLIEHGHVRRPLLGVSISEVSPEDAEVYRLPSIAGVLVEDFAANSPAKDAGLERHDVITALDGRRVDRLGQLQRLVAQKDPGDTMRLSVIRFGDTLTATVRLGEARLATAEPAAPRPSAPLSDLGLDLADLDEATSRTLGFATATGVVIVDVQPWGPAFRKNIAPGLRLVSVSGTAVASARQARAQLRSIPSGGIASLVLEAPDGRIYIANVRVP
ncbi:MAG: trypsin-like peptidase domain-containing protein [Longimicrobiales bacterium]